jgi:8-oxo-dGTP diphosphatase
VTTTTTKAKRHPRPLVAVDVVAVTVLESDCKVLLIRRGIPPQQQQLALPGGFVRCGDVVVDQGEDLRDAARRELREETRVDVEVAHLLPVKAFGAPLRDPRTRVISVAFLAVVRPEVAAWVRAGSDAAAVVWTSVSALADTRLAFDHDEIAAACLDRLRRDIDENARALVPRAFAMAELRAAVDAVTGAKSDPGNFRRRFLRLVDDGVVEPAEGHKVTTRRPAAVWRYTDRPSKSAVSFHSDPR